MHTGRSLTVCRSLLLRRGGGGAGRGEGGGLDLIPLNFHLGCEPRSDPPQFPPWVWAWRKGDSVMAFYCGLLLCPSVMTFWFGASGLVAFWLKVVFCYGLLVRAPGVVPSGLVAFWLKVVFCYGLLVRPSGVVAFCYSLRRPYQNATLNQKTTFNQKATKPEGYFEPEGHQTIRPLWTRRHQTTRPPYQKAPNQKTTKPEGTKPEGHTRRPHPWSRHPQNRHPPSRHPPEQTPWADTPGADTPGTRQPSTWDQTPPGDLLQTMLGYHLQCMLG